MLSITFITKVLSWSWCFCATTFTRGDKAEPEHRNMISYEHHRKLLRKVINIDIGHQKTKVRRYTKFTYMCVMIVWTRTDISQRPSITDSLRKNLTRLDHKYLVFRSLSFRCYRFGQINRRQQIGVGDTFSSRGRRRPLLGY